METVDGRGVKSLRTGYYFQPSPPSFSLLGCHGTRPSSLGMVVQLIEVWSTTFKLDKVCSTATVR
jgi:hypothetical protein